MSTMSRSLLRLVLLAPVAACAAACAPEPPREDASFQAWSNDLRARADRRVDDSQAEMDSRQGNGGT